MRLKNLDILLTEHMFFPYEQFIYGIFDVYITRLCATFQFFTLNDLSEFFNNKKYLSNTLLKMFGNLQNCYVTNVA